MEGIVGFKPTHGRMDLTGVKPLSARLDTLGLLAREVEDVALLGGWDPPAPPAAAPRIAFVRSPWWEQLEEPGRRAMEGAAARVAVAEREVPADFARLPDDHDTIMCFDAAHSLAGEREYHGELLSETLREYLDRGRAIDPAAVDEAVAHADACRAQLPALFADHDALLVPAALGEAPLGLDHTGEPLPCRPWTLLGLPTITIPAERGPSGMPIGVQLVGPAESDQALLNVAVRVTARTTAG